MKGRLSVLIVALAMATAMATLTAGSTIGIDVGLQGSLPPINEIVQLLKSRGVTNVRIYDGSTSVLNAFANQGIKVSVTVPNNILVSVANSQQFATSWVQTHVQPYLNFIDRIVVGNEWLHDTRNDASKLLAAMQNIYKAVVSIGVNKKVTTVHAFDVVQGFPPSAGTFGDPTLMGSILQFIQQIDSAIMFNIYPYFTYVQNSAQINLDYALGNAGAPSVVDSGSGKTYTNLLDAQVDTVISAMKRVGFGDVRLILGESGWPSAGGPAPASVKNAQTYNQNLVNQVLGGRGTPLRPGVNIPTYIFALFNENNKPGEPVERNFGLYNPDKTPVYSIKLSVP